MESIFFHGGRVIPMTPLQDADALLAMNGIVAAVGRQDELRRDLPPGCREIHLEGNLLLPGFVDSHAHLYQAAFHHLWQDLGESGSLPGLLSELRSGNGSSDSGWLLGRDWDESRLAEGRTPSLEDLEGAVPDQPVLIRRICGHKAVVNRAALSLLDLSSLPAERVQALQQDGFLLEKEVSLAVRQIPMAVDQIRESLEDRFQDALKAGVTRVGEIVSSEVALETMREIRSPVGLHLYLNRFAGRTLVDVIRLAKRRGRQPALGLKVFMDGSIGASTAALVEPYADSPGRGALLMEREELTEVIRAAQEELLQVSVHAIGDAAIEEALAAFEQVDRDQPVFPFRHRIEHAVLATREQLQRIRSLGLVLSMQPNFVGNWGGAGGLYEERLGDRAGRCNPMGSARRLGIPVALGSDCMPLGPLYGITAAMEHPSPAERLSLDQALTAYSLTSCQIMLAECRAGRLLPGTEADLVVIGPELLETPAEARVRATYRRGTLVHEG